VLKRAGSDSKVSHSVKVAEVDYNSLNSLTAALQGQDAVVCTIGLGNETTQNRLIDASVASKVKRFIPGEFGSDLMNPNTAELPVFASKIKCEKHLEEKARTSDMTYTYIMNGGFLDWGLKLGFILDLSQGKPSIYDGGDQLFSTTTTTTVGKAIVGVLSHYEETKNRAVYVQDTATSQNKLLDIVRKLTPGKTWEPVHVDLKDVKANSDANVAKGIRDMPTMFGYLFIANFGKGYGRHFQKLDNELLGIKEMTDEQIEEVVKASLPKN
jgi:hypothetical protein